MRRVASYKVVFPDGNVFVNQVVELSGSDVVSVFPLTSELPVTEWFTQPLYLRENADTLAVQAFTRFPSGSFKLLREL